MISAALLALAIHLPWVNGPTPGTSYDSKDHPNGVFVVEAYQLNCGYCNENAPHFGELAGFYSYDPRVQFIDLGLDRVPRDYDRWIALHHPAHVVLMDAQHVVWAALGGSGTPTTYVLDCKLDVKWSYVGVYEAGTREELKANVDALLATNCPP